MTHGLYLVILRYKKRCYTFSMLGLQTTSYLWRCFSSSLNIASLKVAAFSLWLGDAA